MEVLAQEEEKEARWQEEGNEAEKNKQIQKYWQGLASCIFHYHWKKIEKTFKMYAPESEIRFRENSSQFRHVEAVEEGGAQSVQSGRAETRRRSVEWVLECAIGVRLFISHTLSVGRMATWNGATAAPYCAQLS